MGKDLRTLKRRAREIRILVLDMITKSKSAHIGSSFSAIEVLVALYFEVMNVYPRNPEHDGRDRFILSKGHAAAALYATLGARGFFKKSVLDSYYQNGSTLAGHATKAAVPGVEMSTGSLGHGLSIGAGIALAGKRDKKNYRVFVLLSDGECNEGSNWEAILFAAHHKLDNLIVLVDYNKWQSYGRTSEVANLEPFSEKWKSFGWEVKEINGHDFPQILGALKKLPARKSKPTVIIANTVKGKGLPYEDTLESHYRSPTPEEYEVAKRKILEQ